MTDAVKVALAQIDLIVGDVAGNTAKIIEHAQRARDTDDADIVVFPELSVCGYPPEDLLFHAGLRHDVEAAVNKVRAEVFGIAILLGFPEYDDGEIYNTYWGLEPRAAVSYNVAKKTALKSSYNRTFQYIQQASNTASAFPTDQWFSANLNIKPQIADQVALGVFKNFNKGIETSVEAYYKWMQNQIDYRDNATLVFNENLDGELLTGTGRAYGAEFFVNKTEGKTTGFISYTLARTTRTTPGINNDETYLANFDIRNNVSVVLTRKILSQLTASASFTYTTGRPYTTPVGKYFFEGDWNPVYGERNNARLPDYHRLDVGLTWKNKDTKKFKSSWNLSVYNAYNRANAYAIYFREATEEEVSENGNVNTGDQVAVQLTLFKIIPSITWNFEF